MRMEAWRQLVMQVICSLCETNYVANKSKIFCDKCYRKNYYVNNRDVYLAYNKKYRDETSGYKQRHNENERIYYASRKIADPAYKNHYSGNRREKLINSINTEYGKQRLRYYYIEASKLGLTVDHIIPLQGEFVSGLHVPWNITFISRSENTSKGNRVDLEQESIVQFKLTKRFETI